MKRAFLRIEAVITRLALALACVMLAIAVTMGLAQIGSRLVGITTEWTEVITRFALIWMVFLGIPAAFRQGAMVSVDVVHRWAPAAGKRVLDVVVCAASLGLLAVCVIWGWDYAQRGAVQTMMGLEGVSMRWAYLAVPVGAALAMLGAIGNLLDPRRQELETAQ